MKVRFFTFEQYHAKPNTGSTKLRVHNLVKYWDEAELYKYGEKPDVMIFQKVYQQADYKLHTSLDCIKILDICDPDWLDRQNIVETIAVVDGVTVPSKAMKQFLEQVTDKPIAIIKDRHDVEEVPPLKQHYGQANNFVWFGYKQNAELLKGAIRYLERMKYKLTVISNEDPQADRWAEKEGSLNYEFIKYDEEEFYETMQNYDLCILPQGNRPEDRFKSNNKTTKAWLTGLPVVKTAEEIEALQDPVKRQSEAERLYNKAIKHYNCKESVKELKEFIDEVRNIKTK